MGAPSRGGGFRSRCLPCRATPGRIADNRTMQDSEFAQLLSPVPLDVFGGKGRARSASDAGVLRRKGRLKEQDQLIDFIVGMHKTHTCQETMKKMERWIQVRRALHKSLLPSRSASRSKSASFACSCPSVQFTVLLSIISRCAGRMMWCVGLGFRASVVTGRRRICVVACRPPARYVAHVFLGDTSHPEEPWQFKHTKLN